MCTHSGYIEVPQGIYKICTDVHKYMYNRYIRMYALGMQKKNKFFFKLTKLCISQWVD